MSEHDLPDDPAVRRALLLFLRFRTQPMSPEAIYGPLADQMKLSSRQRLLKRATRDEPLWHNRVQTARKNLLEEGFMEPLQRGEWRLSPAGRAEAARQAWLKTATLDDLGL